MGRSQIRLALLKKRRDEHDDQCDQMLAGLWPIYIVKIAYLVTPVDDDDVRLDLNIGQQVGEKGRGREEQH